jgi:hypothetical protein
MRGRPGLMPAGRALPSGGEDGMKGARNQEKCPGCDLRLGGHNLDAQIRHMQEAHPEIVEKRLVDAGFVKRGGEWVDRLA